MKTNISTAPGRSYSSIRPYSLQGLGGVIWAGCLLLLAALVPVNPRDITSDWQVAAAARAIGGGPAGDAFVTHVLVLLYVGAGLLAAVALATVPFRCEAGVRSGRALLKLAEGEDTPVVCGRETPLAGAHIFPASWRDNADALYGVPLSASPAQPSDLPAAELLGNIASTSATKPVILTLGRERTWQKHYRQNLQLRVR